MEKIFQKIFFVFMFVSFGVISFFGFSFLMKEKSIEINPISNKVSKTENKKFFEDKTITLILVGDIMLDRGVKSQIKKYNDWRWPFLKIAEDFKKEDIVFGNLEGPISDKGTKVGSIYSFRADPKVIEGLTYAGFNVLSLANNHALDYGREALKDTLLRLKEAGINYVGAGFNEKEAFSPLIIEIKHEINGNANEVKGTKIGFLAYTNLGSKSWRASGENPGLAWINENDFERIKEDIKSAKEKSDILIVSLHSGNEYQKEPNQFQVNFAKMAIDSGADLVVGHHPHVVQKNERYKQGWIFYSLGNFIFDQRFSQETMRGQIIKVLIKNGKIKEVFPIEIKINFSFQPEIKNSHDEDQSSW
ncbi:MAG: hypothetical protein C4278_01960 [Patescibacteria group bacterium]